MYFQVIVFIFFRKCSSIFNFLRNLHTISTVVAAIQIPTNSVQGFSFLHILTKSCYFFVFFDDSHSNRYEVMSPGGFTLHLSMMIGVSEHLYMYPLAMLRDFLISQLRIPWLFLTKVKNLPAMQETWIWSLDWENTLEKGKLPFILLHNYNYSIITSLKKKISIRFSTHFFNQLFFFFLLLSCLYYLHILDTLPLSDIRFKTIFLFIGLPFYFVDGILPVQK